MIDQLAREHAQCEHSLGSSSCEMFRLCSLPESELIAVDEENAATAIAGDKEGLVIKGNWRVGDFKSIKGY